MFLAGVLFSVLALIPLGRVYLHLTPVGFEGNVSLQGSGVQGGGNEQAKEMCGHGISSESLHDVFRATILAKITYCLPAWSGYSAGIRPGKTGLISEPLQVITTMRKLHRTI